MRTLLLITIMLLTASASATVYKWVDKDGKVHYSDTPVENSQTVEFKSSTENNIKLPPPVVLPNSPKGQPQDEQAPYQISITSPYEEETLRDNNGEITITASIEPELATRHKLVLLMDGKRVGVPQSNAIFKLENVDRGEHVFEIHAIAQNGKQLASTPPRTVFLHRAIINSATRPAVTGQ
ncbi:DUF4124 domain-containing protein [Shewanella sp. Isolate11]|uniref:DUF4124 domain-containing protein n=1 Tax=Shewanella sp. Isolate11 TaxID=2908530 RepID=UPI001EFCD506|nr:DUF4124 domain-containing protein [Shewanella sp. Isolate11]MCG9697868.1 DUF4124 domain-containing protein [Shewanella sp. Isolate11]